MRPATIDSPLLPPLAERNHWSYNALHAARLSVVRWPRDPGHLAHKTPWAFLTWRLREAVFCGGVAEQDAVLIAALEAVVADSDPSAHAALTIAEKAERRGAHISGAVALTARAMFSATDEKRAECLGAAVDRLVEHHMAVLGATPGAVTEQHIYEACSLVGRAGMGPADSRRGPRWDGVMREHLRWGRTSGVYFERLAATGGLTAWDARWTNKRVPYSVLRALWSDNEDFCRFYRLWEMHARPVGADFGDRHRMRRIARKLVAAALEAVVAHWQASGEAEALVEKMGRELGADLDAQIKALRDMLATAEDADGERLTAAAKMWGIKPHDMPAYLKRPTPQTEQEVQALALRRDVGLAGVRQRGGIYAALVRRADRQGSQEACSAYIARWEKTRELCGVASLAVQLLVDPRLAWVECSLSSTQDGAFDLEAIGRACEVVGDAELSPVLFAVMDAEEWLS